ncbi:amidohydrolase family protein [Candidatus Uabimicrobium amorphum]|uniref:Imidazolonepropionase n=1 Tax=Uabimicrobium amorphum TaxID=2596890 RepID=A0A5S9ILB8_UABAM|nr:amidohydrolase family protein [Candidatus Uabimicrobium amorphum]BBM83627.1 imidazolonepropionase [Candidatus Uabimicrobium amorphum]
MKFILFMLTLGLLYASDIVPGAPQEKPIAITNATIHTVSGDVITNGTVLFDKGVITAIGEQIQIPKTSEVIDAKGKHVYPGLIVPYSTLGLVEIGAVRASKDTREVGPINPNAHAYTAYNMDSEIIPTVRSNGILIAHILPQGRLFCGTSSIMMLDGWTVEDASLKRSAGIYLSWPSMTVYENWWIKTSASEQRKNIQKNIQKINDIMQDARKYQKALEANPHIKRDIRWEALLPMLQKKVPLFINASEYKQIEAAVAFAKSHDVRIVIVGGADSWKLTHLLSENDIPVILQAINSLPRRGEEDYDLAFRLPQILEKANVKFCLSGGTDGDNYWNIRNLPFQAGTAIGYGLNKNTALRAITLSAAEILGIDERVGSIEIGKDATIIISRGDVLDIRNSHIEHAFIQGRKVDLDDRHKRLWRKYQQKYK